MSTSRPPGPPPAAPALREPGQSTVGDYGTFLRRHLAIVVIGVVAGLVGSVAILAFGPQTYSSSSDVLVLPLFDGDKSGVNTANINLDDEALVVTSAAVVADARHRLHDAVSAADVVAATEVTVPANTTILSIAYRAGSATAAQAGARALAQAYLAHRQDDARSILATDLRTLQQERTDLAAQLQAVVTRIGAGPEQPDDRSMRTALATRLRGIGTQLASVAGSTPLAGRIVADASLPQHPRSPRRSLVVVSGLLAGLLAGLTVAALRELLLPRLRDVTDIARRCRLPVLAMIRAGAAAEHDTARLCTLVLEESERAADPVRSYLVAATSPQAGWVAGALVRALDRSDRPTTLLRPGSRRERPLDQQAGEALARGSLVVIDAPARAGHLAPLVAEALIVVVELGRTRPRTLQRTLAHLHRDHHRISGVVAVQTAGSRRPRWRAPAEPAADSAAAALPPDATAGHGSRS